MTTEEETIEDFYQTDKPQRDLARVLQTLEPEPEDARRMATSFKNQMRAAQLCGLLGEEETRALVTRVHAAWRANAARWRAPALTATDLAGLSAGSVIEVRCELYGSTWVKLATDQGDAPTRTLKGMFCETTTGVLRHLGQLAGHARLVTRAIHLE